MSTNIEELLNISNNQIKLNRDSKFCINSNTILTNLNKFKNSLINLTVQSDSINLIDVSVYVSVSLYFIYSHTLYCMQTINQNSIQSFKIGPSTKFKNSSKTFILNDDNDEQKVIRSTLVLTNQNLLLNWNENLLLNQANQLGGQFSLNEFKVQSQYFIY